MSEGESGARWYAVVTGLRSEKRMRDQLAGQGIEVFLPVMRRVSQWKDRKKTVEWPIFPGYCFARFAGGQYEVVSETPGVVTIVGVGNRPQPVPDQEIIAVQRAVTVSDYRPHRYPPEGTPVHVARGPLEGIEGVLVGFNDSARLVLPIHLIQQALVIEVDIEDVTPQGQRSYASPYARRA